MNARNVRIGFVLWLLLIIGISWYALTNRPIETGSPEMPEAANLVAGQQQDGAFYAAEQTDAGETWVSVSPRGRVWSRLPSAVPGQLRAVAASSLDTNLMYAATDEGLFVTRDRGAEWTEVRLPAPVTAIAMDTQMADLAYVATEGPVIYRMTDLGASYQRVAANGLEGNRIEQLLVNAENSQTVLAVTDQGVYRSTSAGENWSLVEGLSRAVTTLAAAPNNPNVVYAGSLDEGFFRSRDGGQSWQASNVGLDMVPGASLAVTALSVDPEQNGTLYAATGYVLGHTQRVLSPAGLYLSVDGGTDWVQIAEFAPGANVVNALVPAGLGTVRAVTDAGVQQVTIDVTGAAASLDSSNVDERLSAAKLLSVAATAEQADVLLANIDDDDPEVGYYVARALGRINTESVVNALVEHVEEGSPAVQQRAILALGNLGTPDAVPALVRSFESDNGLATLSAQALAKIGTDEAWNALIDALRDETYTTQRQAAMTAFEQYGEPAVPTLIDTLETDDPVLRANVAQVLGWIKSPQSVPALRPLLNDTSPAVRAASARSLGSMGDTTSLSTLDALAHDDADSAVRAAAEQAVDQIQARPNLMPEEAVSTPSTPGLVLDVSQSTLILGLLILIGLGSIALFVIRHRGPWLPA